MNYPIGIQDFAKLRENDFVYVDKTALVYELTRNDGVYFLSRPRRFGKSLLVSTIKYYFEGRAEGRAEGLAEGREKGLAEGREEGRAEGREEGRAQGRSEALAGMARKMRQSGMEDSLIMQLTGLTADEIARL